MKRVAIILAGLLLSFPAIANQMPQHGELDSRMRYVAYNPGQVVHLSTEIGATLVVGFSDKESCGCGRRDRHGASVGHAQGQLSVLPAHCRAGIAACRRSDHAAGRQAPPLCLRDRDCRRRPQWRMDRAASITRCNSPIRSTSPPTMRQRLQLPRRRGKTRPRPPNRPAPKRCCKQPEKDPALADRNWRYVARGDRSLTPIAVFDNGYSTVFRFPENERIPAIFVINPDGKEATAPYSVSGGYAQVGMTAREFRLRDGNTVLEVFNLAYDTMGNNPATGTVSPDVQRQVKAEVTP